MTSEELTQPAAQASPPARAPGDRLGLELLAVLGVSYGMDGVRSLLSFLYSQLVINRGAGFRHVATAPLKASQAPDYPWLDIAFQVASVLTGLAPAFLAVVLLLRSPGGRGAGIGLDRLRARLGGVREIAVGLGFAAAIGVPGIGLVYVARQLGLNAQIVVTSFPDVWYRIPTLLVEALQQGISEEVVVCAYLLVRLKQLGWTNSRALGAAALLRGSYHLYQGYGGFIGNAVMGIVFGLWFQRTRRVWPLIVAHAVIDAVSFVGYIYLHDKVSWI